MSKFDCPDCGQPVAKCSCRAGSCSRCHQPLGSNRQAHEFLNRLLDGRLVKTKPKMAALIKDRDEWKAQHENLVEVRRADLGVMQEKVDSQAKAIADLQSDYEDVVAVKNDLKLACANRDKQIATLEAKLADARNGALDQMIHELNMRTLGSNISENLTGQRVATEAAVRIANRLKSEPPKG